MLEAFASFASFQSVIGLFAGVVAGIIGGSMPGISPSMTIALLLPLSLYMPKEVAIAVLIGAYQGAMMGGSISAILINTPGTASAAATMLDGYPMNQHGQTRKALQSALYASCTGGLVGIIVLLASASLLAKVALMFGPPEYFGLMCLSMALIAGISGKSMLKGFIAGMLGLLVSTIGLDPIYGSARFTFGNIALSDGMDTLSVFIGSFAVSELLMQIGNGPEYLNKKADTMLTKNEGLTLKEYLSQGINMVRSGILGAVIGILPGVGGSTASFVAYAAAQKTSKKGNQFGTGIVDGIFAPEAANNAVCGGALVPMLTLGIPGDVVTAILVGALIAHGIKPGPLLFRDNMGDVYIIYVAMMLAIFALAIVGTLGIPLFSKVVSVRKSILLPCVFVICFIGTYASRSNYFSCAMMLVFGIIAFLLRKASFSLPPMIIAFVIGSSLESNFRRSLILNPALGWRIFFTRPLAMALIIIAVVASIFMVLSNKKSIKQEKTKEETK